MSNQDIVWRMLRDEDLGDLHHACRMMTMYPGLSVGELTRYERLANRIWAEITGRGEPRAALQHTGFSPCKPVGGETTV